MFLPVFYPDRNALREIALDTKKAGSLAFARVSGRLWTALEVFVVVMGRIELPTYGL